MEIGKQCPVAIYTLYARIYAAGNDLQTLSSVVYAPLDPFWSLIDSRKVVSLDGGARNKEPFVINTVNGLWGQVFVPRDFEGASIHTVWGVRDGPIGPKATLASWCSCTT